MSIIYPINRLIRKYLLCLSVVMGYCTTSFDVSAQFAPPVGNPGTTAIYKDSSIIIGWASSCQAERGYIDISDTTKTFNGSNRATYGNIYMTTDTADLFVLSLGDGGIATLEFSSPITNGSGYDFAVFENSFDDVFLELAFVEVSSDGSHFVRFPAISLTPESPQIPTFGSVDATKIHNFAGKYRGLYGTPFDLDDLKDSVGIDLNRIIMVRLIDVVGCIQNAYTTYDSQGHKVNDPWPTPFDTGGFDLDAIAVLHYAVEGEEEINESLQIFLYPNPGSDRMTFVNKSKSKIIFTISDIYGKTITSGSFTEKYGLDLSSFANGIYLANFLFGNGRYTVKKIIRN